MKNKTKILIGFIITVVIATFLITGGLIFKSVDTYQNEVKTQKEDYITFLKKHEQKMTDYVISENPKVTSVQWNWNSVKIREVGDWSGIDGYELEINGKINKNENSNFYMKFDLDKKENIIFESMWIPFVSYNEGYNHEKTN